MWLLAWKNLRIYRRRHFFTGIGLTAGFCSLVLLGGYMLRMEKYLATQTIFLRQMGHVSLWKKDSLLLYNQDPQKFSFSPDEQEKIRSAINPLLSPEDKVIPVLSGMGLITNGCRSLPINFTGLESEDMTWIYGPKEVLREIPELTRFYRGAGYWTLDANIVPVNIAPVIFKQLRKTKLFEDNPNPEIYTPDCDKPEILEKIHNDPYVQVVTQAFDGGLGITDAVLAGLVSTGSSFTDENAVAMPIGAIRNLLRTDNVSRMSIVLKEAGDSRKFKNQIEEALSKAGIQDVEVYHFTNGGVSEVYVGAMNFVYVMMIFFLVLVCGIVVLSIANSFQILFMERRSEFATLRSIGFRPRIIQLLMVFENIQVALMSFAIGGALGFILKSINNSLNLRFRIPGFSDSLQFVLEPSFMFTVIIGLMMMLVVVAASWRFSKRLTDVKVVDLMRSDS
jgi:ABC-type lipoprotein release transport system permease subunit